MDGKKLHPRLTIKQCQEKVYMKSSLMYNCHKSIAVQSVITRDYGQNEKVCASYELNQN